VPTVAHGWLSAALAMRKRLAVLDGVEPGVSASGCLALGIIDRHEGATRPKGKEEVEGSGQPMTMSRLGRVLGVTMGAATNIADKLLAAGCIARERGTSDRRVVYVRLTEKGRRVVENAESEWEG
jgi:DNA-binding MarR family transcriptional regulator